MAVMLPGETNALPFGIGVQPPEAQQVNTLNIFDDGSQQDQTGTLTSTNLSGFNMGPGLNFTGHNGYVNDGHHPTFGEPAVFPTGISFGSVTVDPNTGSIQTNVSLSSVQVLNLMMGQGNDHLSVTGSLVPGPFANDDGTPCFNADGTPCTFVQGGLTLVQGGGAEPLSVPGPFNIQPIAGGGGYTVTRTDGLPWSAFEFTVGQELLWGASPFGSITTGTPFGTITAIAGNVLTVTGSGLPGSAIGTGVAGTLGVFAPVFTSTGSFNLGAGSPGTITRNDLLAWQQFGFAMGQQITVDGVLVGTVSAIGGPSNNVLTISGPLPATACAAFGNASCTVAVYNPMQNQVAVGGNDITVTGGGGPGPGLEPTSVTGSFNETATAISRASGSWLTDGFVYGMVVEVNGSPVGTIAAVTATTITLSGAALTPGSLTGATILGFAPSPLVVYGGTSQDGLWYSGDPHTLSQRDFGLKPFPTQLGNGSPDFIFPVADPFVHNGNNVIDASADFAAVPEGQVPSVGVILYGGPGNNTIYGSQAPDFIAGGSGNTTIYGERGDNQLLGNDGINVDVITRALSFPTVNTSVFADADRLLCTQSPTPHCNNLIYGNTSGAAGETTTDRFGDYNNVIFGAKGIVTQDTKEATVGYLNTLQTVTANLVSNVSSGHATLTCASACFSTPPAGYSTDVGMLLSDSYGFLGTGTEIIAVSADGTTATLSRNGLNGASVNGLVVGLYAPRPVTATLTANAGVLLNTAPPGTDEIATLTCTSACFLPSDAGLTVYDSNVNIQAGTTIMFVSVDSTTATLSKKTAAGLHLMNVTVLVGGARPVTVNLTSDLAGNATLTCPAGCFNTTDVGLTAADINVNISAGTVIVAVDPTGKIATLSRNVVFPSPPYGSTIGPLTIEIGPPTGYCRPTGSTSDSPYCKPSGTTPWNDTRQEKLQTTGDILTVSSAVPLDHGNDTLYGSGGDNVIIGGDGNDSIQGGPGRNLIIGGSVLLDRTTHLFNFTNPRFQDLGGTIEYNTTSTNTSAFGASMTDGTPECDPTGHAWWGDFLSNSASPAGTPTAPNCTGVAAGNSLTLTKPATATGTVTLSFTTSVANVTTASGSTTVTVASGGFVNVVAGMTVSGSGIAAGTTVSSVTGNSLTLSKAATATGKTILTFTTTVTNVTTTSGSATVTVASGGFPNVLAGMAVSGTGIAASAAVSSITSIGIQLSAPLGTPGSPQFLQDSAAKGADYIAGGSGSSYIFGESNNNVIQAHGSIDITYPTSAGNPVSTANQPATGSETSGDPYAGASSCAFAGFTLGDRVGACRTSPGDPLPVDPTLPLQLTPSIDNYGPNYSATGTFAFTASTITRSDGLSWADSGFAVGQTLDIGGVEVGVITGVTNTGTTSVLTLSGSPLGFVSCASSCSATATLVITDGETYVEGGRGNNVIFANQGQNDIVGGNSDLFSLTLANGNPALPALRASGSNIIFGGSGDNVGYGDCTNTTFDSLNTSQECVTSQDGHAHDANVITANNADVIRLVGTNHTYGAGNGDATFNFSGCGKPSCAYLNYNYDISGYPTATERIIARAVTPLDNTPGGPDLAGEAPGVGCTPSVTVNCALVTGSKAVNGVTDIGGTPVPGNLVGSGQPAGTIQQGSEIHVESGDAFVYGGPADDTIFGGAQNDTIILGYGDNWVSGGRGDQCIIGGGGRCLVSRNGYSEPLYGIAAIPSASLNQLITTPGNAQEAVINVAGALNYSALLYPYNWDPTTWVAPGVSNGDPTYVTDCKPNQICPTYAPVFGHNIIYGGWGNGVVHGGPGDSAISGAEAPTYGFADNFNMFGTGTQAQYLASGNVDTVLTDYVLNTAPLETDFFHPFNPGNAAGYMPETDPPNGNQGRGYNIGKSLYFNAEDPRRQIELFPTVIEPGTASDGLMPTTGFNPLDCEWSGPIGSTCAGASAAGKPFFLTFNQVDPNLPIDATWNAAAGFQPDPVTGDKALFGDLGNDYVVAGMGRVRVYGGSGNDLIDLRASTVVDNGLNDMPVPNSHAGAGSPDWEALAYGGSGQDIYFAGTAGDRLIDWVGNHNSYFAPFSQFGMPTVSRTLMPFLPEFLYALSKSDGADQTLGVRADAFCATSKGSKTAECSGYPKYSGTAARNGEPFGELGLILQHDPGWHEQAGPPFNEMPENLGGVGNDVQKTANVMPFASAGTCDYRSESSACTAVSNLALPNGAGVNLPSGTNTPGAGSVPLLISGTPGATVSYTLTEGSYSVSGTGVIGTTGKYATSLDLSSWPDGTITVTATLTLNGKTTSLTTVTGKNSVAPPAPGVTSPAYANIANEGTYNVTVTGQVGAIANVVISDGQTPIAHLSNGMDVVGSNGSVIIPVDVSALNDGLLTISVTLTNGAGDGSATTLTVTKDTVPPNLAVVVTPPVVNAANVYNFLISLTGDAGNTVAYAVTDGTTTLTGSRTGIPGSGKWSFAPAVNSLKDGMLTVTVTETETSGNQSVYTTTVTKDTVAPAAPTVTLNSSDDTGISSSDYITTVAAPHFTATGEAGATVAVYVNGTLYTGQALSPGSYTVTATATDAAGNTSAAGTAPKTLVIDTAPPSGSFGFSGSVTVNGQAAVNTQTVTLTLSLSDAHGMGTMAFSTDGTHFSSPVAYASTASVTLPSSAEAVYTVWVRATDAAGNAVTTSQTVRLDMTGPTITSSPAAGSTTTYDLGTSPAITYSAADVDGISTITASLDGTTTISSGGTINLYILMAGQHTVTFTGTDKLGNSSATAATIWLHPTLNGLVNAVNYGANQAFISSSVKTTLLATLASAQANPGSVKAYLATFVTQVGTKSNKITASYVTLLTSWANDLSSRS